MSSHLLHARPCSSCTATDAIKLIPHLITFSYDKLAVQVIAAGATTLNIPDTTGWNLPHEFGALISDLRANVKGADDVIFSTHCQNDLGLSTANSLAGARSSGIRFPCGVAAYGQHCIKVFRRKVQLHVAPCLLCNVRSRHARVAHLLSSNCFAPVATSSLCMFRVRRCTSRRTADRVHDQRHRRARRQCFPRRSRHGDRAARRNAHGRPTHGPCAAVHCADEQNGERLHGHGGATAQGDRRRERVCARERDTPGWDAEEPRHVRTFTCCNFSCLFFSLPALLVISGGAVEL